MGYVLAIDIGNTRAKWGICDAEPAGQSRMPTWTQRGAFDTRHKEAPNVDGLIAIVSTLPAHTVVRLCSVIDDAHTGAFVAALESRGVVTDRVRSAAASAGIENGYSDPLQLGADRFAAHIAAHREGACNQLVVLAGTALTVDVVDASGRFHGGTISPGLYTMLQSLRKGTALLPMVATQLNRGRRDVPTDTDAAIATGVASALVGPVLAMHQQALTLLSRLDRIVIAGGDSETLAELLTKQASLSNIVIQCRETLVLDGVFCAIGN
jgi:type III pantothenate kinase